MILIKSSVNVVNIIIFLLNTETYLLVNCNRLNTSAKCALVLNIFPYISSDLLQTRPI